MDILFAEKSNREVVELKPETVKDLAIQDIVDNISDNETEMLVLRDILTKIPKDIRDMQYRQDIMKDLMENDQLVEGLTEAAGLIRTLRDLGSTKTRRMNNDSSLYTLLEDLRELSVYVQVTEMIYRCLKENNVKSDGLKIVLREMENVVSDEKFEIAKQDIETMLDNAENNDDFCTIDIDKIK